MKSKALVKSTNDSVVSWFFARTPRIWRIVKICDVGDRFLRKSFWLCLSIFSILDSMQFKKAQNELHNVYPKEQTEYIQNQINKIRYSAEDRQSRIAWQTVNEVSRRKSTARAKLKAYSQEEWIHMWKEHFDNLLGKPPKVTDEPIAKIISYQLDIKVRQFTQEELDSVPRNIKNREAAGLDEIPPRSMEDNEIRPHTAPIM